jgi:hypothetical protein
MEQTLEQTAMRKVYMRLLPFSVLCMFVCYLDRVNVGFAALTMNKDLGLSAYFFRAWRRGLLWRLLSVRSPEQPRS